MQVPPDKDSAAAVTAPVPPGADGDAAAGVRTGPELSAYGRRACGAEPVITRLMSAALARPDLLSLAAGFTDNRLLPDALLGESLQRIAAAHPDRHYLQYGHNAGRAGLRAAIVTWLRQFPGEADLALTPEDVLVTNGSQQALYNSVQLHCEPGDTVLVEAPTYFVFLELLKGLGVRAVSMPVRPDGSTNVEALPEFYAQLNREGARVRLLYVMGVFANPSARCWTEVDKQALGRWLQTLDTPLPVIEDMAYRELFFEKPWPARSVLSLPEFSGLPALYLGTFDKPLATGLKLGFAATADTRWRKGLATLKGHQDFGSSNLAQALVEDVLEREAYAPYLASIRPRYAAKARLLDDALRAAHLTEQGWRWERPEGGLLLWLQAPEHIDTQLEGPLWQACLEAGVFYVPGDLCIAEGLPRNALRLSFGALPEDALAEAARRLTHAALSL